LHPERKARGIRDADRLDGAILGDAFDDDAFARLEDALPVQRIDADGLASQQFCECAAGRETDEGMRSAVGSTNRTKQRALTKSVVRAKPEVAVRGCQGCFDPRQTLRLTLAQCAPCGAR
jgi:hypothetical protein